MECINRTKTILIGVLFSYVVTFIFLLLYSIVLAYTNISENTIPIVLFCIGMISVFLTSSLCAIKLKKSGLKTGGLIGFIYVAVLYMLSSFLQTGFMLTKYSFCTIIFYILIGIFGGIVGVNLVRQNS